MILMPRKDLKAIITVNCMLQAYIQGHCNLCFVLRET